MADWFQNLLSFAEFQNHVCFCIIAKYKPSAFILHKSENLAAFRVAELSKPDTQNLFLQYLRIMGKDMDAKNKMEFISQLNGVPAQTIYAANIVSSTSAFEAKELVRDIREYSDHIAILIYDFFSDDEHTQQVLILLSKFEIVSYDMISQLFDNEERLRSSLQALFDLSVFNFMFSGVEYLKLNSAIADYINRSRLQLNTFYDQKLRKLIRKLLAQDNLDNKLREDYSEFLFTLQNMVLAGKSIPKKFFIPSYILKTIVQKYYDKDYRTVVKLSEKLLENRANYDEQIIRETIYWLCQAYARNKDDKFFEVVKYFKQLNKKENKDYYFLVGFYHRCLRDYERSEEYYQNVLKIDSDHSRTKRELVIVYMSKGDYISALHLAHDNYRRFPTNIYHAQAYFTCLIKKYDLSEDDLDEIEEIMEMVDESLHSKSSEISIIMRGEYEYYINNDLTRAISILKEALLMNDKKYFAYRSLQEIYRKRDMKAALNQLQDQYGYIVNSDEVD